MNTLKLNKLRLQNFKGIDEYSVEPDGVDTIIAGANATGKTSVQDAFFWLFFGKDSHGRADFQIKPVNEDGTERHNLDTEVETEVDFNGQSISLMKRFREKWTKKRGSASPDMTGHTTEHYIDGVPKKKKEYDDKVGEIIRSEVFRLVTDPNHFNNLKWNQRRDILLGMCGDVSNEAVIESDSSLKPLLKILDGTSIEDHRARTKASQKKINDELKEIPARIDELENSISDAEPPDEKKETALRKELEKKEKERSELRNNEAVSKKRVRVSEIQKEINDLETAAGDDKKPIREEILQRRDYRYKLQDQTSDLQSSIESEQSRNQKTEAAMNELREQFKKKNAETIEVDTDCPTCGQRLPEDQIEATKEKFNNQKAEKLKEINKEGKELKASYDKRLKSLQEMEDEVVTKKTELAEVDRKIEDKQKELDKPVEIPPEVAKLKEEKEALEKEVSEIESGVQDGENMFRPGIDQIKSKLDAISEQRATYNSANKTRERITELTEREKELAKEYERLESEMNLMDKFIVQKVEMLEEHINSFFSMAQFSMFNVQINGGIEETCETTYQGVPWGSLNNAARINTGLDIINALSNYYQFRASVWIDNAEAVNELLQIEAQTISLYVTEDEELTYTAAEEAEAVA